GLELLAGLDGELNLGARADEDDVWRSARSLLQDVGALRGECGGGEVVARCRALSAREGRHALAGECEARRTAAARERLEPCVRRLVGVRRTNDREVRD